MKKAIITGITGQDGAYLSELLLNEGYAVYGTYRRSSSMNFWRIEYLGIQNHPNFHLVEYDLNDQSSNIRNWICCLVFGLCVMDRWGFGTWR